MHYDRLLHSPYFHRLSSVTQVVPTTTQTALVHTRMTHSMKVAQLARELSESLLKRTDADLIGKLGGLDPDVAASAGLAHDFGHPPFGHIAEQELDKLLVERGVLEGYDGNAQTFRIVTLLAAKRGTTLRKPGLDLTAATRNAVIKYPVSYEDLSKSAGEWDRQSRPVDNDRPKFNYYSLDINEYAYAREAHKLAPKVLSLEAQIMDLCDDISYAVHDLEDWIRTGTVRVSDILDPPKGFVTKATTRLANEFAKYHTEDEAARIAELGLTGVQIPFQPESHMHSQLLQPYRDTTEQQAELSSLCSYFISLLVNNVEIDGSYSGAEVHVDDQSLATILMLKYITREMVINSPSLAFGQIGNRATIRRVFGAVERWLTRYHSRDRNLSGMLAHIWSMNLAQARRRYGQDVLSDRDRREKIVLRATADYVASLTEPQVSSMDRQIQGMPDSSPLNDWLV